MKLKHRLPVIVAVVAMLGMVHPAQAQDTTAVVGDTTTYTAADNKVEETTTATPRNAATPSATQWDEKTSGDAYSYRTVREYVPQKKVKEEPPRENFLVKVIDAIVRFFGTTFGIVLLICLFAGIVILLVYRLVAGDGAMFSSRNRKINNGESQPVDDEQNLLETHWERLLREAIQKDDKRLAVRYSYMWLLQMLQERSMIQYRQDKTNITYYYELAETQYGKPFRQLMRQYEYAWYGHFLPSATDFEAHMALFADLKKSLQR